MILTLKNRLMKRELGIFDWIIFMIFAVFCFFTFCHVDLLITAQHSCAMLDGNILDFYSACYRMNDTYSANYLPITFVIFAIWNIPMKLFGLIPNMWAEWNTIFVLWNKLLPTLVYILSALSLYNLCFKQLDMDSQKSRLVMYIFMSAPVGFFSQFMFCQYDIFTVFFLILGLSCYYNKEQSIKKWLEFIICFGLAVSFKYYAILVFVVLVLLKEKKIMRILLSFIGVIVPCILQIGLYIITDRAAFMKAVFGFGVLEYVNASTINVGFASIKLLPVAVCVIAACSYFTIPKNRQQSFSYGIYYSCGMFFALFSFMTWHPQWLLIAVPFWTLGICINKKYEIMLWLEILFFAVFLVFTVNVFKNGVDQNLLKYSILAPALRYSKNLSITMSDLFIYHDENMLFSLLVVILLVLFVFNHPKFHMEDFSEKMINIMHVVNIRFIFCILLFILPAIRFLPRMLKQPEVLWSQTSIQTDDLQEIPVNMREDVVQYATVPGNSITDVYVSTRYEEIMKNQELILKIREADTKKIIATSRISSDKIKENGISCFKVKGCETIPGKQYEFLICSELGYQSPVYLQFGAGEMTRSALFNTVQKNYTNDFIEINGRRYDMDNCHIIYQICGHYKE